MVVKILSYSIKQNTRKAMQWFEEHEVPYEIYNLRDRNFTYKIFLHLLHHCTPGEIEFLSTQSVHGVKLAECLDNLTINELYKEIVAHPNVLAEPIIFDDRRVLFKFQEIEMTQFLSRAQKRKQMALAWSEDGNEAW
ncbi:MAG: ArsC/Spx/MgsR family protein [Lysinibacillus sp.]